MNLTKYIQRKRSKAERRRRREEIKRGLSMREQYADWIRVWENYGPGEEAFRRRCQEGGTALRISVVRVGESSAHDDTAWQKLVEGSAGLIDVVTPSTISRASGDFLIFLRAKDRLSGRAPCLINKTDLSPSCPFLYADEDWLTDGGERCDPWFKCAFGEDLFLSQSAFGRAVFFRRNSLPAELPDFAADLDLAVFRLALEAIRTAGEPPLHCPGVLVHRSDSDKRQWKGLGANASERRTAVAEFIAAWPKLAKARVEGPDAHGYLRLVHPLPAKPPLVSIIIPTRDRVDLLRLCVTGILEKTAYTNVEIVIVDNDSREPATKAYFDELRRRDNVTIVPAPEPFNFSRLNNLGVAASRGDVIGLLNNDIEVISPGWLTELVAQAMRPDVGAVGAKLYYPDDTVQHAGVVVGLGDAAAHVQRRSKRGEIGYAGRLAVAQDYTSVTGACLFTRREIYDRLNGLDEINLAVAYNDIDYCLRAREAGYRVIFTPYAELYHHESATRGSDLTPQRLSSFYREREYLRNRWATVLADDPYYNPNLSLSGRRIRLATPPRHRIFRAQ